MDFGTMIFQLSEEGNDPHIVPANDSQVLLFA